MTVAFLDCGGAVNLGHFRAFLKLRRISAQPHGAAFVVVHLAGDLVVALNPFLQVVNHGGKAFAAGLVIEFLGTGIGDPRQIARGLDHRHLHAQTDAQIRHIMGAGVFGGFDFAFGSAFAKSAGHKDRVEWFQMGGGIFGVKHLGIDPFQFYPGAIGHAAVGQGLGDGFIGVAQLGVFADNGNFDFAFGIGQAVGHVIPAGHIRHRGISDAKGVQNGRIQPFAVIGQRRLVDGFQIIGGNHVFGAHVAEQPDFGTFLVGDRMFGTTDQNLGCDADRAQLLNAVLGRFGFQFARCRQIGDQRQVHENTLPARLVLRKLADGLEKRQGLDIAHGAADFAQHEIDFVFANRDEILDFVGDMRNHLNGFAQIIAAPFLFQHGGIDSARGNRIGIAGGNAGETLVMAKVQIGFRAIIGDKHFAMFKGRHRAGIDVQIRVQFAQTHGVAAGLQQGPQSRRGQPLAKA